MIDKKELENEILWRKTIIIYTRDKETFFQNVKMYLYLDSMLVIIDQNDVKSMFPYDKIEQIRTH